MKDSYIRIRELQRGCANCNSNKNLHAHHRIFRSEGENGLNKIFQQFSITEKWGMHDIQNLIILCEDCHINKVHGGDSQLREFFRNSYTHPVSGFNLPFIKINKPLF